MSMYVKNFHSGGRRNGGRAGAVMGEKEQWSLTLARMESVVTFVVAQGLCSGIITEWASFCLLSQNMLEFSLVS